MDDRPESVVSDVLPGDAGTVSAAQEVLTGRSTRRGLLRARADECDQLLDRVCVLEAYPREVASRIEQMLVDVEERRQQGQAGIVEDLRALRSEGVEPVAIVGDGDDPTIAYRQSGVDVSSGVHRVDTGGLDDQVGQPRNAGVSRRARHRRSDDADSRISTPW